MKLLKTLKKNTILLLIITVIVLYFVLKEDYQKTVDLLKNIDIKYFIIAIILYIISVVIKGYVNYLIVNDKEKVSLKESIRQNTIAQFFNGITPFQTGGEPMEIYMLTKCGISLPDATNIKVQGFIFYQIALVICGVTAIGYNFIFKLYPKVKVLKHLVLLGFSINVLVVVLLLLSFSKKMIEKAISITTKVVKKFKIKIKEEVIKQKFEEYYLATRSIKNNKKIIIIGIALNILSLLSLYIIPLFVVYSFNDNSMNAMDAIVSSAYVYLIGSFVPVPGASGGIEYSFTQFFSNFLSTGMTSATLIIWRGITYYLGIIIGCIVFNLGKKENKK